MELSDKFKPQDIEGPLYEKWEAAGCFQPPAEGEGSGRHFQAKTIRDFFQREVLPA